MDKNIAAFPESLQQAIIYFADYENCHRLMMDLRWPDGRVICPRCGSDRVTYLDNARLFKCYEKHDRAKFSLKVGTIFEDSPIGLDKWLMALWMVMNCKNGISSCEMARDLKVTQKTAWFMDHRLRLAVHQGSFTKMGGEGETIEVDETYIGGLARNMHKDKRQKKFKDGTLTGGAGKTAVFGLLERGKGKGKSRVQAAVIPTAWRDEVREIIRTTVEPNTNIYSDEHGTYRGLDTEGFQHAFVTHAKYYVDGVIHTNGMENFWSLFKRGIKGTYVSIEPFHTFRYLDEQAFRFNMREGNDADRFLAALSGITGKRLTYKTLTGKREDASPAEVNG